MALFLPIERMLQRVESNKQESDIAYYFDLLLLGEQLTKTITLFLVAAINEDKDKSKYRHEHFLVRASAIGDFSKTIDDVLVGPTAEKLSNNLRELEYKELTQRMTEGSWQYQSLKLMNECLEVFKIDHDPLGVKVPLRLWFQYFTLLRNKTKGHGATKFQPCSLGCPILYESIMLIVQNLNLFKRTWAYLHRNLSGKYRVSYLTENSTELDYLKRDQSSNYENGVYCFIESPRKINLLFSDPELSDFYFPNGNLRGTAFETISYVSDDRVEQSAKNYLNAVTSLPSSETEGLQQLDVLGSCFTNLPALITGYVTRTELEKELKKVLMEEDRFPVVTLLGRGGIGKTSLAINVIREIAQTNRYELIVWFSARDIDLLLEGPKQVQTRVVNQKDIATDYCKLVYPETEIKDKLNYFSKELSDNSIGKTLFIFDNFETITNPLDVYEWLNTCIRNPNKILITSRTSRDFKADYPIEVRGMSEKECRELIHIFSQKFEIREFLTPDYLDELILESDGHPYIIKMLLGEVAISKKIGKVQRVVAEYDNVLSALFHRTFYSLSPASKRVFLTLCSWNSAVPQIAIEAVLWRPENEKIDVRGAIDELQKSSFIELMNDEKETFINVPLAASIYGKTELEVYPEKLKILEDRELLMEFGASTLHSISTGFAMRIERKFSQVAKRIKSLDEFERELPSLEYIASKYPKAWEYILSVYEEYEDYKGITYSIRELLKTSISREEKAKYWWKLANIYRSRKEWEGESHALSELAIIPGIPYDLISDCANRINNYFHFHQEERQVEYKKVLLKKMIDVMTQRINEGSATDYSRLAWLLINNNEVEKALIYVKKGLEMEPDNTHCLKMYESVKRNSESKEQNNNGN